MAASRSRQVSNRVFRIIAEALYILSPVEFELEDVGGGDYLIHWQPSGASAHTMRLSVRCQIVRGAALDIRARINF